MGLKMLSNKKLSKKERENSVLLGLVDLYLKTGSPIGSNTLKERGFDHMSSATIRNYFSKLEEQGYLFQQHTSGGRVPTEKGIRMYVNTHFHYMKPDSKISEQIASIGNDKEIASFLNQSADYFSDLTNCAVFISKPRFDQDFIQNIRCIDLSSEKLLCVLVTDFGLVRTETLYTKHSMNPKLLEKLEQYFFWRLSQKDKPQFENEADAKWAQRIYNEIMVRHLVNYVNFTSEDIYRTGLSKLLHYPEFAEPEVLASTLAIFENESLMLHVLKGCLQSSQAHCWIGEELKELAPFTTESSLIAIPYFIQNNPVGAIVLLGPVRMPYKILFSQLSQFSKSISDHLTKNTSRFHITYRQPINQTDDQLMHQNRSLLLENKVNQERKKHV